MPNRIQIKAEAKEINRSARVNVYLFTLLALAITWVMALLKEYVNASETLENLYLLYPQLYGVLPDVPAFPSIVVAFVGVASWLVGVIITAGYGLYHLGIRQGREMPYGTLADGLGFIGKLILLNLLRALFVALWTMLFIVPGIIAAYRYRFAVYNLCENPELSAMEALNMSKVQTAGFKSQLFLLDLSFLGWILLSSLTLNILNIWLAPYREQSNVGYFVAIKQLKGVGYQPPQEGDDTFRPTDPFQ